MIFGRGEKQAPAAEGRCHTVAQHAQQVKADMATMVGTGGIAVVPGIVGRRPGSRFVPGNNRMAVERPRRTESENGHYQPQREETFDHACGTLLPIDEFKWSPNPSVLSTGTFPAAFGSRSFAGRAGSSRALLEE